MTRQEGFHLAVIVGQHQHGDVEAGGLDRLRQLRRVHVLHLEVGDDQVETRLGLRQGQRLRPARHMCDAWRMLQVEFEGFADQELVEAAVFAQDEGIVEAGNQEDVLDPEGLQFLVAFEQFLGVDFVSAHGRARKLRGGVYPPRRTLCLAGWPGQARP